MSAVDFGARNNAVLSNSLAARKTFSVAGINTASGQMDWLIPSPPAGYRIAVFGWTGGIVTGAASTCVWTILTGSRSLTTDAATIAANTTTINHAPSAASTVTAVYRVPLVSEVQPADGRPMCIGGSGQSVHIHGVSTSATAGTLAIDCAIIPDNSAPCAN